MKIEYNTAKNAKNIGERDLSFERVADFDFVTAQFTIDDRQDYGETRFRALGFVGRRLPTVAELQTIVERENYDPAINNTLFPNAPSSWFWSSSPYADNTYSAWFVYFFSGYVGYDDRSSSFTVRLVRGGQSLVIGSFTPSSDFINNGDGTVTHKRTGLMWQQCAVGQMRSDSDCQGSAATYTYDEALKLTSNFAAYNDWRLPTADELSSIVEYGKFNPTINTNIFPHTSPHAFWSSSPYTGYSSYAWSVHFYNGIVTSYLRSSSFAVRLVRGGQWIFGFLPLTGNTSVYGKLHSNSTSGAALAGATVSIGTKTTSTAKDGKFSLRQISSGQQVIRFSKSGYNDFATTLTVPSNGSLDVGQRWLVANNTIAPTIAQAPMAAVAGSSFIQWGIGFTANGTATLHIKKPDGSEYPTLSVRLDADGKLYTPYKSPLNKAAGTYRWWAIDDATQKKSNEISYSITAATSPCVAPNDYAALLMNKAASCRDKWNLFVFYKIFYLGQWQIEQNLLEGYLDGTVDSHDNVDKAIDLTVDGLSAMAAVVQAPSLQGKDIASLYNFGNSLGLDASAKMIDDDYVDIWAGAIGAAAETVMSGGSPLPALEYATSTFLKSGHNLFTTVNLLSLTQSLQEVTIAREFLLEFYRYGSNLSQMANKRGLNQNANMNDVIADVAKTFGVKRPWYWLGDYYVLNNINNRVTNAIATVNNMQSALSQ